jgi:hypothetical protein
LPICAGNSLEIDGAWLGMGRLRDSADGAAAAAAAIGRTAGECGTCSDLRQA